MISTLYVKGFLNYMGDQEGADILASVLHVHAQTITITRFETSACEYLDVCLSAYIYDIPLCHSYNFK